MTGEAHHYTTLSGGLPTIKPESSCPESSVPFSSDRIFRVCATSHLAQVQMAKRRDPTPALPCTPPSQPPLGDSLKASNGHPASEPAWPPPASSSRGFFGTSHQDWGSSLASPVVHSASAYVQEAGQGSVRGAQAHSYQEDATGQVTQTYPFPPGPSTAGQMFQSPHIRGCQSAWDRDLCLPESVDCPTRCP